SERTDSRWIHPEKFQNRRFTKLHNIDFKDITTRSFSTIEEIKYLSPSSSCSGWHVKQ
ncbi:12381_t:CDS:2, partial [Funneliformis caledonium]